jgi:heme exporter protein D
MVGIGVALTCAPAVLSSSVAMPTGTTAPRGREAAFAACLALVLTVGVLGVLLLNTVMQQQADQIARQHQRIAALTQQAQMLRTALDWQSDPAQLAAMAKALRLRPVKRIEFVSARRPAAGRGRAG